MKKLLVLLSALYSVLAFGTAIANDDSSLSNIPPAWSKALRCDHRACPRFEVVLRGAAVLDHETGLVWEKSPSSTYQYGLEPAGEVCSIREVGGRKGWHLPTIDQLASLVDTSAAQPALPVGHPFQGVQNTWYWSFTKSSNPEVAWFVDFQSGYVGQTASSVSLYVWCVRGGQTYNGKL